MGHVYIEEIGNYEGQEVTLKGWLYNKRSSGKLKFLLLRDGTGIIQCVVFKGDVKPETFEACELLTQESSFMVEGTVRPDPRSPGGYELSVKDLQIGHIAQDYPITPKEHGVAFLMEHRHLWLRSSQQHAILRVRHEIIKACRDFFDGQGFTLLDAPIFTPSACEGTTTLFETNYFDDKAYLTQSGQLYMEAGAMAFGKVYCFGPTFRAEKSKTRRHLTEFWMIEPEVAYFTLNEDMDLAEDLISYLVQRVLKNKQKELEAVERDVSKLRKVVKPFSRISYDEALEILKKQGLDVPWGEDLGGDEETVLAQQFETPVLVHRYPAKCKAFYMKEDPENKELALCVDMLAPEGYGEIIGGGQREDNLEVLEGKIKTHGLPMEAFRWYVDLRKYGSVPHAGFGLGIERMVGWLCGLSHVREAIPFPRMLYHLYP
ncbi:MAG: asparagine--tRNA ligase [Candidatus Tectomicrobia bacterium]|uniref:Asparagine--tRNA ligase n=1 Tax=Tectimicrobiota bacterium TaxID=2528274 RepID=A0A933LPW6_UNCTE|nr:asparagine--tRNA ligase [Candidatus Tectomicrobia bacterium]